MGCFVSTNVLRYMQTFIFLLSNQLIMQIKIHFPFVYFSIIYLFIYLRFNADMFLYVLVLCGNGGEWTLKFPANNGMIFMIISLISDS